MEIKTQAFAGSMESNDVLIMVRQGNGLEIELDSPLKKQFGKQIIEVIEKTVKRLGVDNIYINVQDMGALNCTIEARCEVAIRRACENEEYAWEVK